MRVLAVILADNMAVILAVFLPVLLAVLLVGTLAVPLAGTLAAVQPNKYKTDPYFLQIFQSSTSVCFIICVFCMSCEPICELEIVLKIQIQLAMFTS